MKISAANTINTAAAAYSLRSAVLLKTGTALLLGALLVSHAQAATQHVVKSGETLSNIAVRYDVSQTALIDANGMKVTDIQIGQTLEIPDKDKRLNSYKVKAGDSLSSLAKKHSVDLTELARVNNISPQTKLLIDSTLVIPADITSTTPRKEAKTAPVTALKVSENKDKTAVTVQPKVVSIVKAEPISPSQKPAVLSKAVPATVVVSSASTTPNDSKNTINNSGKNHIVKYGETLSKIAGLYKVEISDLAQVNDMKVSDTLYFGKSLVLPVVTTKANAKATTTVKAASSEAPITPAPTKYKVQSGDTLTGIANKFKVDFRTIAKLSGIEYSAPLKIGQLLTLPN
ncbi:LysM peptidoglycan-binding domain-containing protein [Psychrobacter frigidicola]|uniref:LysM peptidoglycan-binding domain-containing protein n=1 Tax=Psychrobacter frigidicola TaxID=45611 RepID=A0A5C7AAS8_9GAMM|nr:LysM peptidoglycan-binding domain-containing protein [Psychrobacter frigidicola]TXD97963.1 LysM peptidoglycan-binding domain-containing protein [Psychrobacter frigidicola]